MPIPPNYVKNSKGEWCHPSRVGAILSTKPQPDPLPALDHSKKARPRGKGGVVVRVTLIRCGSRLLDDDNLAACFKGLRDAIAYGLAIDDADPRIKWEYGQVESKGERGTVVKLERT